VPGVAFVQQRHAQAEEVGDAGRVGIECPGLQQVRIGGIGVVAECPHDGFDESALPVGDEMLLMARALGVTLDRLIPGGDDERVELGDDAEVSPRWIREMLSGGFYERLAVEMPYEHFPVHDIMAEVARRAEAERKRAHEEQILDWAEHHGITLMAGDLFASHKRPSDSERHAAQRLGVEPSDVQLTSRALWKHLDFDEERDRRVGDIDQLPPRSRQARRGLVTRQMIAQLRVAFEEMGVGEGEAGDGER
jgi:hypothetical protein